MSTFDGLNDGDEKGPCPSLDRGLGVHTPIHQKSQRKEAATLSARLDILSSLSLSELGMPLS